MTFFSQSTLAEPSLSTLNPPSQWEAVGKWSGIILGSAFSPTWPLLKWTLAPHLPLDSILEQGLQVSSILELYMRLHALDTTTLFGQLLPVLLLCLLISTIYFGFCGWL